MLKQLKHFEVMLNIFEFSPVSENVDLDWSMQISSFELPNHISRLT